MRNISTGDQITMRHQTCVTSEYGIGTIEFPIDLNAQIDKQLRAAELMIATLQYRPVSSDAAGLLAETLVTREQLALLKTYVSSTHGHVIIHPAEDDYLIIKAIGERLDNAILESGLARKTLDQLEVILNTVKKGMEIAGNLTAS